ncbi:SPW repeat domain-containing protein [Muricoccus aerilatus]|uniref:SPW repeat domain-containing protein n=1 Tax=Muricoccus aerilatus TaxID=452982 RepID=UPI0005C1D857|nr:SPW repeat protein [Roseomonas aerilata]
MRFVSTRTHGMIDYVAGIVIAASPWIFGFADGGSAQWIAVVVGLVLLASSLMTDYELGVVRVIPMPVHLGLDLVAGLLLAVSPWLFGFSGYVWLPHLILGAFEIMASLITRTTPDTSTLTSQA